MPFLLLLLACVLTLASCRQAAEPADEVKSAQDPLPVADEIEPVIREPQFLYGNARSSLFPDALLLDMVPPDELRIPDQKAMYVVRPDEEIPGGLQFNELAALQLAVDADDYVIKARSPITVDTDTGCRDFTVVCFAENYLVELSWGEKYRKVAYSSQIAVFDDQGNLTDQAGCDRLQGMVLEGKMLHITAFSPKHQWLVVNADGKLQTEVSIFFGPGWDNLQSKESQYETELHTETCRYIVIPVHCGHNLEVLYRGEYLFNQDCRTPDGLAPEDLKEGYMIYRFGNEHVWPFSYARELDALAVLSSGDEIPGGSGLINLGGLD